VRGDDRGSRLDLILAAPAAFAECFVAADVMTDFYGSDHAPVWADLQLAEPLQPPPTLPKLSSRFLFSGAAVITPLVCACLQAMVFEPAASSGHAPHLLQ